MARFVFKEWELDVDVESTRGQYGMGYVPENDPCTRNYRKFCGQLTDEETAFFEDLGINPQQTGLLLTLFREKDGSLDYAGYYHAVGRLLRAPEGTAVDELFWDGERPAAPIQVGRFGITPVIPMVEGEDEPPRLTLRFSVVVPWLLRDAGMHRIMRRKHGT